MEVLTISSEENAYIDAITGISVLTDKEFNTLYAAAKAGDNEAYDKLIIHNLKLVVSVAKRFKNADCSLSFMDLIMEGNLGLYKAVDNFDPDLGYQFSTYAYRWIYRFITNAIQNKGRMIRYPFHINSYLPKYKSFIHKWQQENCSEYLPPKEEVMVHIPELTDVTYRNLVLAYRDTYIESINMPATTDIDEANELVDFIPDQSVNLSAEIERKELATLFDELIERFASKYTRTPEKSKDIIYRRFGMHGYDVHKLEEIGNYYGVTKEAIRRVEEKFIKFCRTGQTYSILQSYR